MLTSENRLAAMILRDDFKMKPFEVVGHFERNGVQITEVDLISLYPPGNTPKLRLTHGEKTHTVKEWALITGLSVGTIWKRYKLGWATHEILTLRARKQRNSICKYVRKF